VGHLLPSSRGLPTHVPSVVTHGPDAATPVRGTNRELTRVLVTSRLSQGDRVVSTIAKATLNAISWQRVVQKRARRVAS
jgi:hypothetical protein